MLFSSVSFLYGFLPVVVLLYYLSPQKVKNLTLLLASLFFYFYGEPIYCLVMVAVALTGYGFGLLIGKTKAKWVLWMGVAMCLLPLLAFKYSDFFIENINALLHGSLPLTVLLLPIGISFYTFQILSYLIDVYRGKAGVQKNPVSFLTYVTLFPQLIAGPIVRYQTIQDELDNRTHRLADLSEGIVRFCIGLGKKVLLADSFYGLLTNLSQPTVLSGWLSAIAFTLQIYFDFSGYSDMAIGLGKMFGFHFPENFDHPYASGSITEFWRRWHISLGSWFRDYVYIPLGGNRCSHWKWIRNLLIVWFLTGFWHGAAWNFILWGLYFAVILLAEKLALNRLLDRLPKAVRVLYTMLLVTLGFVLFQAESLSAAAFHLRGMLGFADLPIMDAMGQYLLKGSVVLFLIGAVGASPLPAFLGRKLRNTKVAIVLEPLFCGGILLLVTAFLVDGTFSPFLYFRF